MGGGVNLIDDAFQISDLLIAQHSLVAFLQSEKPKFDNYTHYYFGG